MVAAGLAVTVALAWPVLAGATSAGGQRPPPEVVPMEDSRLKFEINETDGDGGIQAFIDAEDWLTMSIYAPNGERVFHATASGRMAKQGGTELFLESGEPSFDDLSLAALLRRWPAGRYHFRGRGLDGELFVGTAVLSHAIPEGPELVSPLEGSAPQDPDRTVMRWRPVPPPQGSPILGYEVIVERDTGIRTLPTRTLDVTMPPTTTELAVPPGFLRPGNVYSWEVLAIAASGNQTLSSSSFMTARG